MTYSIPLPLPEFDLWQRTAARRTPISFDLDLTARCNLNCRHCYINLPAGNPAAKATELTLAEIEHIAGQAVSMGALWCLLSGGEPLLRPDFADIYLMLKRLGLLVSVFTNATLVTPEHVALFKRYPPRAIEVTVYGVTRQTYEAVTRRPGSFAQFQRGLGMLQEAGIKVTLKAMALQSNVHELAAIATFCRERSATDFRFDPFLHLRYDGDPQRNAEIRAERLSPEQVVAIEQADPERLQAVQEQCGALVLHGEDDAACDLIFHCGAGTSSFSVTWDGHFRLCSSLVGAESVYDLRQGSLQQAWEVFAPQVRDRRSHSSEFWEHCHHCPLINLCAWCPASAALETGRLDGWVESFCHMAQLRYAAHHTPDAGEGE